MADVNMNDFLLQYYMQLHFNAMPPEIFAKYQDYVKADDFRGNMKDWKSKLMHQDNSGKWVKNGLPDPNDANGNFHLTDDEWKKLFNAFQGAMRGMSANTKSFAENAKANAFLEEYFGDPATHLFSNGTANQTAEAQIQVLKNLLSDNTFRSTLNFYIKDILKEAEISYSDLLSGINSKKYNTDPKFQTTLKQVASYMNYYVHNDQNLANSPYGTQDFSAIESGFDDATVSQNKLDYFKRNYKTLLNTLHNDSKVYEVFKSFDKGKISKSLDAALSKVDYANKDSKDYVPPKRSDELTPWQHLQGEISDTLEDYMGKYIHLRGDRLYFSDSAKLIIKAIDGTKFKPTDGIAKVLENAGKIKENLLYKSPRATDHFDWFSKTLGELKSTMPKAFDGALKNARQMKALIEEMIIKAVRENKIDEAKTAMEVLSVIKYGYTTSKIMDTLSKEQLTIFSDGGLSWNKNEGVKFVTTAMDKSIKAAFMGVGYVITAAGNAYKLSGSKFNGKTKRIKGKRDAWLNDNATGLQAATQNRDTENQIDITDRGNQETILQGTGITDQTIAQEKQNLETFKQDAEQKHSVLETASTTYNDARSLIDEDDSYTAQINQLNADMQQIAADIAQIDNDLRNPNTFAGMPPAAANAYANDLMRQKRDKQNLGQKKLKQTQDLRNQQMQINQQDLANARANIRQYQQNFVNAERNYNAAQSRADDLNTKINDFTLASSRIKELNDRINKRNEEVSNWDNNHKDKYKELLTYWDFLESGRDSHTGNMYSWMPGSAKKKQAKFDANKIAQLQAYMSNYNVA